MSDLPTGPQAEGEAEYIGYEEQQPLRRPGYLPWLIGLWLAFAGLTVLGEINLARADEFNPTQQWGTSCVIGLLMIPTVVLQMMWIHRVHKDARFWGDYRTIPAGLALGLSFIPRFRLLWMAICMYLLSGRYGSASRQPDERSPSVGATRFAALLGGLVMIPTTVIEIHLMRITGETRKRVLEENPGVGPPEIYDKLYEALAAAVPIHLKYVEIGLHVVAILLLVYAIHTFTRDLYAWLTRAGRSAERAAAIEEAGDLWPPSQ